jgi:hypothetical protein
MEVLMEKVRRTAIVAALLASILVPVELFLILRELRSLAEAVDSLPKSALTAVPPDRLATLPPEVRQRLLATARVLVDGQVQLDPTSTVEVEIQNQPIQVEVFR